MTDKQETIIQKLCKPLDAIDVELRVGNTSAKGFSLLIYKTARTDVKRLNDVCGINWQNEYFYDTKGILSCSISIKHDGEWVSRVDVGTESMTEKEKGSYSDAFKRAGFKWGIGAELYNSPLIWVNWEMDKKTFNGKDKFIPKGFYGSDLDITDYSVDNGVVKLEVTHKKKGVVYSNVDKKDDGNSATSINRGYNGTKPQGVTAREMNQKFEDIKEGLEACVELDELANIWKASKANLLLIKQWDEQFYDNLVDCKEGMKQIIETEVK